MTSANDPADVQPVIALFCTLGVETFLSNAIQGILQVGIEASQIVIGCPNNAIGPLKSAVGLHSDQVRIISTQKFSANEAGLESYSEFGSRSFTEISWKKILFIRELIENHSHVIYADLDISWIRNPVPYLLEVAKVYPIAVQTEGLPRFPPALCCGFASFAKSERAIAFLDALIEFDSAQLDSETRLDDQAVCQRLIEKDTTWLHDIFCLPEALFPNGLGYRNFQHAGETPCPMTAELLPYLFHANWTIGIDNKRRLLEATGTWLLEGTPPIDQAPSAPGGSAESGERHALLTVVYPVFDVRADVAERIRRWTEEQDLHGPRYRVLVVAGAEAELDQTAIRKVLRSHDAILRARGPGREVDYWNAGARQARTPWLLFVEGHGVPERDSLSALVAWITANPHGEACNFRITNLETHRIAKLMKRWFAETHADWVAPSSWRRLHRTAFAIRRDVFEEVGPFEPRYGQFAPPLLSARLHQRGVTISALPTSGIVHDDSPEIFLHHADTENYARGELEARANNDILFFEKYFGPSPGRGPDMIVPARHARAVLGGILVSALHRPGQSIQLLKHAFRLLPAALVSLRDRARLLAVMTSVDEWLVTHSPMERLRWDRFRRGHRRLVRTEQMRWMMRNPLPSLWARPEGVRWPVSTLGQYAFVGLHALEYSGEEILCWTHPIFLLRLNLNVRGVLTLEIRNLRCHIGLSDIVVIVAGRELPSEHIGFDDDGNIALGIEPPSAGSSETDVIVIVPELREPAGPGGNGRHLGLPLFSVSFGSA